MLSWGVAMCKKPAHKSELHVWVDTSVLERFKEYVFKKYGTLHTYLGEEVTRALEKYLEEARGSQEELEEVISKPNKRHVKLLYWLAEEFPVQVTQIDLENFIVENFGTDKRTRKKYINDFLVRMRFIEVQKAIYGKNIIYRVYLERIVDYLKKFVPKNEVERLELILKQVKEREGQEGEKIVTTSETTETPTTTISEYAVERYEAGDTLDEIKEKLETLTGAQISKKGLRSIIRKELRKMRGEI